MAKTRLGQSVVVTWEDAWQTEGYATPEELAQAQPKILQSQGFLLRDDKVALVIGMDQVPDGRYRDIKYIPRGMVTKVRTLR